MTEPRRLIEAPESELEAALLRAGRSYRATDHTRTRALAALGLLGTSAVATPSAAAGLWAAKVWVVAGLAAGVLAVGIGSVALRGQPPAPPAAAPLVPAARPEPAARPVAPPAEERASQPEPSSVPAGPVAPRGSASGGSLTAELAALDAASRALQGGDAAGALRLLDDHARRFPRGRLGLEAEVLRIEALAKAGNRAGASSLARGFLARHPNSVLAPRVERYAR